MSEEEVKDEVEKSTNIDEIANDEKLIELDTPADPVKEKPTKSKKKEKKNKEDKKEEKDNKLPYKNMGARKIVLLVGFAFSTIGFALMAFSIATLLSPNEFATLSMFIPINITSCACSFVGMVLSVAGANTKKGLAKLSFFFATLGFILSAGMLVVMLIFKVFSLEGLSNIFNNL